jgi:hypothetical protein
MTSITLPVIGLTVSIAAAVLVLLLGAVAGIGIWQSRVVLPRRIKLLEDTLRVYNGANATLGCRLAELETALLQSRARPAIAGAPEPVTPPRVAQSAAQRYGTERTGTAQGQPQPAPHPQAQATPTLKSPSPPPAALRETPAQANPQPQARALGARAGAGGEFSEAELRLAQLIKSRLSSLRVG